MPQHLLVPSDPPEDPHVIRLEPHTKEPAEDVASDQNRLIRYDWIEDDPAAKNYMALGQRLAQAGDLFRRPGHSGGLMIVYADGEHSILKTAADLAPCIVDRVALTIYLDGKPKGSKLSTQHMNAMLRSEAFLGQFPPIDIITSIPRCLPDFSFTQPGYSDMGVGYRYFYVGPPPLVIDSLDRVNAFLGVMDFATEADRTNTVAAALTVLLRDHWLGGKPIALVTANKSHAGKDTIIAFASCTTKHCAISYQATNWALERSFIGALGSDPEIGVVVIENARLERTQRQIASAYIERFATDPQPFLFSTGTGPPTRRKNDIVMAISTNFGLVSEDILNRSLPIHLTPVGNVADRASPIGNPKLEFLPQHRDDIAAELRGMVNRWRTAGQPLDKSIRHPFSEWAAVVGGILKTSGFQDFLANYGTRRVADDPLRQGLGLLGAANYSNSWQRPDYWARQANTLGLVKQVIPPGDQDSAEGRKRGIGVVLSAHQGETFLVETDSHVLHLRLEKRRGRFDEPQVHVRYRFVLLDSAELKEDAAHGPDQS